MKYEYMKESEQMLQYFQFPKFLLKLRISQTAKFLYMILYDRARISRKNSWIPSPSCASVFNPPFEPSSA